MNTMHTKNSKARGPSGRHQRGVIMLFGLIAMVIMMIGAVAMIRSMNTSLFNAGNFGFKRDLTNQGERAMVTVLVTLQTGVLATDLQRQSHSLANNYSATFLPSNAQGLPNALVDDAAFASTGFTGADIVDTTQGVTVRYVLDRLCANTGLAEGGQCTMTNNGATDGGSATEGLTAEHASAAGPGGIAPQAVYRLSVRVDGPRRTQAYFQSTLALPL
jgi:type IV pilus assembly protein PilX